MHIGELALPVASPLGAGPEVLRRLDAVKLDATREGVQEAEGGEEENARIAGLLCRLFEGGQEELDEQSVRDMIHSELVLITFFRQGGIGGHDAGIADENVDRGSLGNDFLCGFFDGREGQLVALDKAELRRRGDGFGIVDYALGALGVPAREIDVLWGVLCQSEDGLLAKPIGP